MPMHITDWKENFISKMITRGRNYWRAGAVKDLHCTQEKITADVEGTRLYRVEITLAGDAVATLSCTCPFAKEGANCKHMAAVLFAATHLPEAELPAPEWEKKLNSLSAETLRDFLRPLLKKDEALRNRLMLCKGNAPVRADERRLNWQRTLTQTLHAAERYSENEYDEYAEYDEEEYDEEEESPVQELLELMDAELADLLTPEHAMLAFELVCDTAMMFESADEILEQEDIEDACRDAWMQILAIAAPDQRSAMYEWFAAAFRTWKPMPYFTAPLAFLFSYPWDEAIHQRNLALLDEKIAEWKPNAQERGGGAMVNLLNQREKTMQQLHASQEDIISFWHSHWDVPYAHDQTLKTLMAAEKWKEAIEQVKEDLQTFAGEYMPCKQRREQLILLYQRANQPDLVQREIRQYIEQYNQYSMEQIDALRATLPADAWRDEAERLLKLPTTSTIRLPLLASIEQWEQLLQRIQQHSNFEGLCTYFDPLMAWNSARTLALYRDMVNRAMQAASSRTAYCEIIQQLERMKGTDEGRKIIADLAEQWRRDYKRKCALLDELQKAGY